TRRPDGTYGNLYSDLLDYVVFSVLIFYALTIAGIFVLRKKRPDAERPYRAFGYPFVPLLYIVAASAIMFVLLLYKTQTTWPGLLIVLLGVPVYLVWSRRGRGEGVAELFSRYARDENPLRRNGSRAAQDFICREILL